MPEIGEILHAAEEAPRVSRVSEGEDTEEPADTNSDGSGEGNGDAPMPDRVAESRSRQLCQPGQREGGSFKKCTGW